MPPGSPRRRAPFYGVRPRPQSRRLLPPRSGNPEPRGSGGLGEREPTVFSRCPAGFLQPSTRTEAAALTSFPTGWHELFLALGLPRLLRRRVAELRLAD